MTHILEIVLKISLVFFMVGNLFDMGLELKVADAVSGLKNGWFLFWVGLWGFVLCPALAILITKMLPLAEPYAIGLILLGMAPCAPFLPLMVSKARGDLGYAAAFLLVASVFTVVYMPVVVPILVKGLTANAWTIAKPLILFLLVPLAIGMAIRRASLSVASKLHPFVKKTTGVATIAMLILCLIVYGKGFLAAVGSFAIGAQILFFVVSILASYAFSFGLKRHQKSVLTLGLSTRNLGAAFAPLFAISTIDQRAIIMVALGVPMQTIFSILAAKWFARISST